MAHRFLDTSLPSSQNGRYAHFAPTEKKTITLLALCSTNPSTQHFLSTSCSQLPSVPTNVDINMMIVITSTLRRWLTDRGLAGFIKVAEAPTHPNSMDMASKLNIDLGNFNMVCKKLGLSNTGERNFDIFPSEVLEYYFGEYS